MKRVLLIALHLVLSSAALAGPEPFDPSAAKGKQILLTPDIQEGHSFEFELNLNVQDTMKGREENIRNLARLIKWNQTLGVEFHVAKVHPDKAADMRMTFRHLASRHESIGKLEYYDSLDDDSFSEDNKYRAIFLPMIGRSLVFTLSPDGTVRNVKGMEEILKTIEEGKPDPDTLETFGKSLTNERFEYQLGRYFGMYPFKKVRVGDKWSREYDASYKEGSYTYRLASYDDKTKIAVVRYEADVEYAARKWADEKSRMEPRFSIVKGEAKLDAAKGTLVDYNQDFESVNDVFHRLDDDTEIHYRQVRIASETGMPRVATRVDIKQSAIPLDEKIDRSRKYAVTKNLVPGTRWKTRYSLNCAFQNAFEENPPEKAGSLFLGYDWSFLVQQKDEDGTLHMAFTITRINILNRYWGQRDAFDSAGDPFLWDHDVASVFKPLINQPLTFTLSPDGTVSKIHGIDPLRGEARKSASNPDTFEQYEEFYDSDGPRYYLSQYFSYFPYKPVGIGDTWEKLIQDDSQRGVIRFTVKDVLRIDDRPAMEVHYTASFEHFNEKKNEYVLKTEYQDDQCSGILYLEIGTGNLIKCKESFRTEHTETYKETDEHPQYSVRMIQDGKQIVLDNPPKPKGRK